MRALAPGPGRVCTATGFGLVAATDELGWRITKDANVQTSGITGVLVNDGAGPLPPGAPDRRGRYDTHRSDGLFRLAPRKINGIAVGRARA